MIETLFQILLIVLYYGSIIQILLINLYYGNNNRSIFFFMFFPFLHNFYVSHDTNVNFSLNMKKKLFTVLSLRFKKSTKEIRGAECAIYCCLFQYIKWKHLQTHTTGT